ncbi:uncharacterized protein LOC141902544 [Tubulanus polymorphus]|uniref:uncharacterized protein LOC141902544 n=1 Tax=Tubulanus polymorphus TaxID=672921 RepID=UPI003DA6A572
MIPNYVSGISFVLGISVVAHFIALTFVVKLIPQASATAAEVKYAEKICTFRRRSSYIDCSNKNITSIEFLRTHLDYETLDISGNDFFSLDFVDVLKLLEKLPSLKAVEASGNARLCLAYSPNLDVIHVHSVNIILGCRVNSTLYVDIVNGATVPSSQVIRTTENTADLSNQEDENDLVVVKSVNNNLSKILIATLVCIIVLVVILAVTLVWVVRRTHEPFTAPRLSLILRGRRRSSAVPESPLATPTTPDKVANQYL